MGKADDSDVDESHGDEDADPEVVALQQRILAAKRKLTAKKETKTLDQKLESLDELEREHQRDILRGGSKAFVNTIDEVTHELREKIREKKQQLVRVRAGRERHDMEVTTASGPRPPRERRCSVSFDEAETGLFISALDRAEHLFVNAIGRSHIHRVDDDAPVPETRTLQALLRLDADFTKMTSCPFVFTTEEWVRLTRALEIYERLEPERWDNGATNLLAFMRETLAEFDSELAYRVAPYAECAF